MSIAIKCTDLSNIYKEVMNSVRTADGKVSTAAMALVIPIYLEEIKTAEEIAKMFGVTEKTATSWIKKLVQANVIGASEGYSKITGVYFGYGKNFSICNVNSEKSAGKSVNNKTNNQSSSLDNNSLDIDSIVQYKAIYQERMERIFRLSDKIFCLFSESIMVNKCGIAKMLDERLSSLLTADQIAGTETQVMSLALSCKQQFDHPELRPIREDGQPDVILNLMGFFNRALRNHFASNIVPIPVYRYNRQVFSESIDHGKRHEEKIAGLKQAICEKLGRRENVFKLFSEIADDSYKYSVGKRKSLYTNILNALDELKFCYDGAVHRCYFEEFIRALHASGYNKTCTWGYLVRVYFDICRKVNKETVVREDQQIA